ncbi:ComF family protein [Phenylobacterium aquaticum]|uniref:ComF family protein n=1 Tax=Phenylobacterium aquaticum TaxID=1763816 RepID=UPI001F5C7CE9|nr:ComF family protein [Phenylobacterium aquaticum]MCI3131674.1 ComF family protein [Phenylobacterium aquaticum]
MSLQDGVSRGRWKPGPGWISALRAGLDLIFPPQALDDGPRPQSVGLSPEAWSRITFLDDPVCDGCGVPFEFHQGPGVRCAACMARPRAFDRARAACLYDDASRGPILQLKHADRTDLSPLFARWISRAARELIAEADVIVPVPLHPTRLLRRRFNQSAEIARPLARLTGLAYLPDALRRVRATETQGGKSGGGRRRNVAAAFAVPASQARRLAGRRVLLIDDVLTTGATAEGCARALKGAGAQCVNLAVIARVQEAANRPI